MLERVTPAGGEPSTVKVCGQRLLVGDFLTGLGLTNLLGTCCLFQPCDFVIVGKDSIRACVCVRARACVFVCNGDSGVSF